MAHWYAAVVGVAACIYDTPHGFAAPQTGRRFGYGVRAQPRIAALRRGGNNIRTDIVLLHLWGLLFARDSRQGFLAWERDGSHIEAFPPGNVAYSNLRANSPGEVGEHTVGELLCAVVSSSSLRLITCPDWFAYLCESPLRRGARASSRHALRHCSATANGR